MERMFYRNGVYMKRMGWTVKNGGTSVKEEEEAGRPATITSNENIDRAGECFS